jgi:hypothetical protein
MAALNKQTTFCCFKGNGAVSNVFFVCFLFGVCLLFVYGLNVRYHTQDREASYPKGLFVIGNAAALIVDASLKGLLNGRLTRLREIKVQCHDVSFRRALTASKALWPIGSSPTLKVRISIPNIAVGAAINLPSEISKHET